MSVYLQDADFTLYNGDVLDVLRGLPDEAVDCCVTSPPYWGLRDYGADGQLGLEPTPDAYVARLVVVFHEVRRVLADHGTLWLNLGDSYAGSSGSGGATEKQSTNAGSFHDGGIRCAPGLKPKDLVGIPWRVAFALQADGWYLRSDIVWSKPNPMPESVTDRPTKSHEYVFLLTKQPRYFFDQEAVREEFAEGHNGRMGPATLGRISRGGFERVAGVALASALQAETLDGSDGEAPRGPDGRRVTSVQSGGASIQHRDGERWPGSGRNVRSVWEIATQPYAEAHFATYPEELVRRCILAGCPGHVCATCGKPRERIVERGENPYPGSSHDHTEDLTGPGAQRHASGVPAGTIMAKRFYASGPSLTTGWTDCGHDAYRAGIVLDPFMGSGTTALVARKHGRRSIGIELNPDYCALAARRLAQQSLFTEDVA